MLLTLDTDTLTAVRGFILAGDNDSAVRGLELLLERSPRITADSASSKQTYYLYRLTGHDFRRDNITRAEARELLDSLTTTREGTFRDRHILTSHTGDKILDKQQQRKAKEIPF